MRRLYSRRGFCSACCEIKDYLEFHHCVPQRYERTSNRSEMIWLCNDCHLDLHRNWVDPLGEQHRSVFLEITQQFLWEKRNPPETT